MSLSTIQRTMLYCPKCNRTYEEGTQRFCSADGVRLLSASGEAKPRSVFSNLYIRAQASAEQEEKAGNHALPFAGAETKKRIFEPVEAFNPAQNIGAEKNENIAEAPAAAAPATTKTPPRLIRPNEIPLSQAKLGDRSIEPGGGRNAALSWNNTDILLGQTIKGRYRIVEQLSADETSVAYLAEDKIVAGKKVVVRILMNESDGKDDESDKIYAEERVSLSHVNHPNIASLLDSGELPEGKNFIVSEYVEGVSLGEMLRQAGTFNPLRAARIVSQIAVALSEAHVNGILHRSLRPDHIILTVSEAGKELAKVTHFAVFDGFDEPNEETVRYLAPEQLEGRLPNYASDIYSLAVIAYQMLTGRLPFNSSSPKELLKAQKEGLSLRPTNLRLDLPQSIDEILEKALAFKPAERYPKARDFGDAFYNAMTTAAPWEQAVVERKSGEEKAAVVSEENPFEQNSAVEIEKSEEIPAPQEESPIAPAIEKPSAFIPAAVAAATVTPREKITPLENKDVPVKEKKEISEVIILPAAAAVADAPAEPEKHDEIKGIKALKSPAQTTQDLLWEKRSPEPLQEASTSRILIFALGLLLLGVGAWAIWTYFSNRPGEQVYIPKADSQNTAAAPQTNNSDQQNNSLAAATNETGNPAAALPQVEEPPPADIEAPPLPRKINQPPNTVYFQTSKENLKGDLVRNFRGFSFYYPDDWTKNPTETHFIDVARIGATGTPIEQFLVTYYESRGTFSADRENYPNLVEKSSQDLKEALGGTYTLISHGETKTNGDWKAYEMKFQREGVTKNGENITLWGRRLWIPAARPGVRSGFVVTLLATSLSPEVKSADDVGVKGELAQVLETFEPTSLDAAF